MQSEATIWHVFRVRQFKTAVLILGLSALGWAQQPGPANETHRSTARQRTKTIGYINTKYGFCFTLPESWKGYQVLWSEWQGNVLGNDGTVARVLRGPELKIRHPKWTEENPREDLPLMIFTIAEWDEHPSVSAAPFDPGEFGRNRQYVFAVPPRWDYDFAEGWEEAEKILGSKSFHTFSPAK
jgi:hypothetical protein